MYACVCVWYFHPNNGLFGYSPNGLFGIFLYKKIQPAGAYIVFARLASIKASNKFGLLSLASTLHFNASSKS